MDGIHRICRARLEGLKSIPAVRFVKNPEPDRIEMQSEIQIKSFATIRLSVNDVSRSRDWYRSFLQLEPVEDLENFVSFKIARTSFDISLADEKSPISKGGSVGYWLVEDLDTAIKRAKDLGAKVYRGPLRVEEIQRTIAQIEDPFGNAIGLEADFK